MVKESISDKASLSERLGPFLDKRRPHLDELAHIEKILIDKAPLPISYDINRSHPPYFTEYTYTECLGGILASPQSAEITAKMAELSITQTPERFTRDVGTFFEKRLSNIGTLDKYFLENTSNPNAKKIAFIPGSNIFNSIVSKEQFSRYMFEIPDLYIKPHPLTHPDHLRELGMEYGYARFLPKDESGWSYLMQADEVYSCSSTELSLYATILNKPVYNIGNFFTEATGVYHSFFRLIPRGVDTLLKALSSPLSGFFIPNEDNLEEKIEFFFNKTLELREMAKPLAHEMSAVQWSLTKNKNWSNK